MPKQLMSDAGIKRRKKLQSHISETTGALGLTALTGTLLATKRGSKLVAQGFKAAGKDTPMRFSREKIKATTAPILATSAGIGGVGAFNFAAYTNAESRKRNLTPVAPKKPVKKSYETETEMGYSFGEMGIAKRAKQVKTVSENETDAAALGAYGAGGASAFYGAKSLVRVGRSTTKNQAAINEAYSKSPSVKTTRRLIGESKAHLGGAGRSGKKSLIAGGISLGSMAAYHHLQRKNRGIMTPYEQVGKASSASAFGVEHY